MISKKISGKKPKWWGVVEKSSYPQINLPIKFEAIAMKPIGQYKFRSGTDVFLDFFLSSSFKLYFESIYHI